MKNWIWRGRRRRGQGQAQVRNQHYRYELLRRDLGLVGATTPVRPAGQHHAVRSRSPLRAAICPYSQHQRRPGGGSHHRGAGRRRWPAQTGSGRQPGCYQQADLAVIADTCLPCWAAGWPSRAQTLGTLKADWLAEQRASALIAGPAHGYQGAAGAGGALPLRRPDPDKIALIRAMRRRARFSYEALLARANRWRPPCGQASSPATGGVMLARTPQAIFAQLAVLLAGAVYVPLDPSSRWSVRAISCGWGGQDLITQAEYRHKLASLFEGAHPAGGDLVSAAIAQPAGRRPRRRLPDSPPGLTGLPQGRRSHGALDHLPPPPTAVITLKRRGCCNSPPSTSTPASRRCHLERRKHPWYCVPTPCSNPCPPLRPGWSRWGSPTDPPTAFWNEWVVALTAGQGPHSCQSGYRHRRRGGFHPSSWAQ